MIKEFLDTFSNRETAITILVVVALVWALLKTDIRASLFGAVKTLFSKGLRTYVAVVILATVLITALLSSVGFWTILLLKTTLIWCITVLSVLFIHISKIDEVSYFTDVAKKSLRVAPVLPFLVHFFSFSLIVELLLIVITLFFVAMKFMIESKKQTEYEAARQLCTGILYCIGLVYIVNAVSAVVYHSDEVFRIQSVKDLTLPSVMTLLILPVIYLMALSVNYATSFHSIRYSIKNRRIVRQLNWEVLKCTGISLNRAVRIRKGLNYFETPSIEKIRALSVKTFRTDANRTAQFAPLIAVGQTIDQIARNGAMTRIEASTPSPDLVKYEKENEQGWRLEGVYRWGIEGSGLIHTDAQERIVSLLWDSTLSYNTVEDFRRQESIDMKTFEELKQRLELTYGPATRDDYSDQSNIEFAWLCDGIKRTLGLSIDDVNSLNTVNYCELYWDRPSLALD